MTHPLWSTHALWGAALAIAAAIGAIAVPEAVVRRRLRRTLYIAVVFLGLHGALYQLPDLFGNHAQTAAEVELLILTLAVVNAAVALAFNPWVVRSTADRTPAIVQDAIIVSFVAVIAALVFRDRVFAGALTAGAALAFALQEQLGNVFAGLAIQIEKPFNVGHWINVGSLEGRVVEVTWRATKLRTKSGNLVVVPNSAIAREVITNYTEPAAPTRLSVEVGASYLTPPNDTRTAIYAAMRRVPRILKTPEPVVVIDDFASSSINYKALFWIDDYEKSNATCDEVRTAIFYEFHRNGIEIPWPIQVEYHRHEETPSPIVQMQTYADAIGAVPVFATLSVEAHNALAKASRERLFGNAEVIVREGEAGASMFIVQRGTVAITVGPEQREVAETKSGGYFGEMSLLTGDPRTATVTARGDCTVLEISADAFRQYVQENPGVIDRLAMAAAERRKALDQTRAAAGSGGGEHLSLAQKMRRFFGLGGTAT